MSSDKRVAGLDKFCPTRHSTPYAAISTPDKLPPGTVVCIVGASRGIGASLAHAYARAGASSLILLSRPGSQSRTAAVAASCKQLNDSCETWVVGVDITDAADVGSFAAQIIPKFGRLDVAVINSGMSGPVTLKLTEDDPAIFKEVMDVNYTGTFNVLHHLIPLLLKTKDGLKAFIAIGSFASGIVTGPIANAKYCISKLAQARLIEYAAAQYEKEGLLTLSVQPGAVASEQALETAPEEFKKYLIDSPDLAATFCAWVAKNRSTLDWLNGRLVSATWDVEELLAKKQEIVEKNLLKFAAVLG